MKFRENQKVGQSSSCTTEASRHPLRVDKVIETAVEVRNLKMVCSLLGDQFSKT